MKRKYQAYGLANYRNISQINGLSAEDLQAIEVVGRVLPFKTNNYVVEELKIGNGWILTLFLL